MIDRMASNPFFVALEQEAFAAKDLQEQTGKMLSPFRYYLKNSIKSLKKKEISCTWQPVANKSYRLTPDKRIWQFIPESKIRLKTKGKDWYSILSVDGAAPDANFDPDDSEPIYQGKGKSRKSIAIPEGGYESSPEHQLHLPGFVNDGEALNWCGYDLDIGAISPDIQKSQQVIIDSQKFTVVNQDGVTLQLQGHVERSGEISIDGRRFDFELLDNFSAEQLRGLQPQRNENGWLLFSRNRPNIAGNIKDKTQTMLSSLRSDHFRGQSKSLDPELWQLKASEGVIELECHSEQTLIAGSSIECSKLPALTFQVEENDIKEKWIQLIEIEKKGSEDTGKSDLDYFFGDTSQLTISARRNDVQEGFSLYRILDSRSEEKQLLLADKNKKGRNSVYPSQTKNREIRTKFDTIPLQRQTDAINKLIDRPFAEHWPLIKLLQNRGEVEWSAVDPIETSSIKWQVLTNPDIDGCDRQREFVAKALASADFTILDGPPGTGKTTTILELIYQLIARGQRVLLSASTHAAINNVLERIKLDNSLSHHIFPLRVGDEKNADGIEDFQFDNLYANLSDKVQDSTNFSEQLLVDSSNLVCGTTIGILRLFNNKNLRLDYGRPPFDVMIIDECSKTTFQEFLVPARYASKWVLVGDIRQLSPFTDREQIVANLENLMLKAPSKGSQAENLPEPIQDACFLLEMLRKKHERHKYYCPEPILMPVPRSTAEELADEISNRLEHPKGHIRYGLDDIEVICQDKLSLEQVITSPQVLYHKSLYFLDENYLTELADIIPDDMIVLHRDWLRSAHAAKYQLHHKLKEEPKIYAEGGLWEKITSSKWSEEVCWRLERQYWLRQVKYNKSSKVKSLSKALDRLFPKSVDADGRIYMLRNIAFPSILEALSGDGLLKRKADTPCTLNQGFTDEEKRERHITLSHQHRMHPDISEFPREQFYRAATLQNGSSVLGDKRAWGYDRYARRNIWLHVAGKTIPGNKNYAEAEAVLKELEFFCRWAENEVNKEAKSYNVAVLTFYKGQEKVLREKLQGLHGNGGRHSRFSYKGIGIKLATVDYIQGQEADVIFISMVNTYRDGFMDTPNRLNVAVTRARYQLVIVGKYDYFSEYSGSPELKRLAQSCKQFSGKS